MKKPLNMERYLRVYGEQTRGNMLTPNGLKVIREGKEYKFDCWDIEMREHRGERWTIHYDIEDMNQALAVSEDGTLRYMIERKKKVPMALVDYTEQDHRNLLEYKDFNSRLVGSLQDRNIKMKQIAEGFISRQMLEGDLSGRLLTDAMGQHKDRKAEERKKKLAEIVEDTEYEEVSSAEKREVKRKAHEIWDRC